MQTIVDPHLDIDNLNCVEDEVNLFSDFTSCNHVDNLSILKVMHKLNSENCDGMRDCNEDIAHMDGENFTESHMEQQSAMEVQKIVELKEALEVVDKKV